MIDDPAGALSCDVSPVHGVPNLPGGFLIRPRLLAVLDAAAESPLIVLRGPGGAGKSTLVADWLHRGARPEESVVWVSLDAGAGSRVAFWHRLARALHHVGLADGAPVPRPDGDAHAHLPGLLLSMLAGGDEPIRLVLDDFHHAARDVAEDLVWVLERCSRLRLVVTTRRHESLESGAALVRLRGTTVVKPSELMLTAEESAELIAGVTSGLEAVSDTIRSVTGGNPLATRLAISVLDTEPFADDPEVVVERITAHAAPYFLPAFSDTGRREAALRLSIAPYVDRALARALTGRQDVDEVLEEFEREGIASTRRDGDSWRLWFHPLVARALGVERAGLNAAELARLRLITADFLEEAGDLVGAVQQLLDARRYDRVWPVLARSFPEVWNQYSAELEALLLRVPTSALRRNPTLAVALALTRSHREGTPSPLTLGLADEALGELERLLESCSEEDELLHRAATVGAQRAARRYREAAAGAHGLLDLIDRMPAEQVRRTGASLDVMLAQIAQDAIRDGRIDLALSAVRRISLDSDPRRSAHALSLSALIAALRGECFDGERLLARLAIPPRFTDSRGSPAGVRSRLAEAIVRLDRYDAEGALAMVAELDADVLALDLWPYPTWVRGLARLLGGDAEHGAGELLGELSHSHHRDDDGAANASLTALASDLLVAAGRLARARRILARRTPTRHPPIAFAQARIALAAGEPDQAQALTAQLAWSDEATERHRAEAHLLTAVAQARLGFLDDGRGSARHAFAVMDRSGCGMPLAMVPHSDLLELFEDDAEATDRIRSAPPAFGDTLELPPLTRREKEVLNALATTTGLEAVSERLFVSVNTVKTQLRGVYRKLGVSSRSEAVQAARRRGLLED